MKVYNLENNRMLCWDDFILDKSENTEIRMHAPTPKEIAIYGDSQWDGIHNGYGTIQKVGDRYYFYQRVANSLLCPGNCWGKVFPAAYTIHESLDGKTWKKKWVDKHVFNGKKHNNIVLNDDRDNFAVCYDENPDCDPNEKFKAFTMGSPDEIYGHGLYMYVSADGIDFTLKKKLNLPGSFDSYNIAFWDKDINKYRLYYRGERTKNAESEDFDVVNKSNNIIREIRTATTTDFETFDIHGEIDYEEGKEVMQLYTSQTVKYDRAPDMFIALPGRYNERWDSMDNLKDMPQWDMREFVIEGTGRGGTAFTDTLLMTSRDGVKFNRWDESFLRPLGEFRWWYGDGWVARGIIETESDTENCPNELSFLAIENYRTNKVNWRRYTMRLDGFVSWYSKYSGGEVLTKPFTFKGNELELNFQTGAMGALIVTVCDENGNELEGYKTCELFGDSVERHVKFEKDLKELEGKPVRLKFFLKDCDLYSFKFN